MKVLLLNQAFHPDSVATSQYVTDIARFLASSGHEVTVVCGQRDYHRREKLYPAYEEWQGIRIHRIPSTGFGKGSFAGRVTDALSYDLLSFARLMRLGRQDVTVAFTSPPLAGLLGALFAWLRGGRFVHWLMNVNHEMAIEIGYLSPRSPVAALLTAIYRFTLSRADKVVVMDRWMKQRAEEAGCPGAKIATIPLWPVHETNDDPLHANAFRKAHGLEGKFVIAHSGNLSVIHPLDTVLEAAVRLKDDPGVVFAFVGYGWRESEIDACARKHGLSNLVKIPYQPREKLGASLAGADLQLVVMGNKASGLAHSSKIYSILDIGKPWLFVGPRNSHIVGDVLSECPHGFHVEHGDVEGFLRVIEKVRGFSLVEINEYATRNRAFARSRFSPESALQRFLSEVILEAAPLATGERSRVKRIA